MRTLHGIALCIAVTACTDRGKSPPPGSCTEEASINESPMGRTFGPHDVGDVALCLHLDASSSSAAFSARTDEVSGSASPWRMSLTDLDGAVIKDGWDLAIGQSMPMSFAVVELDMDPMQLDAVLHVTAKGSSARTSIQVTLAPVLNVPD